jgi:hypothetical protein
MNAKTWTLSSSSSNSQESNVKCKHKVEDITSPAKRSKQSTRIGAETRSKEELPCEDSKRHLKSSTAVDVKNNEKVCGKCYCKNAADTDTTNNSHEDKEPVQLHSAKSNRKNGTTENKQQRSVLETARAIIDYSPESVFLKRLKERFQAVGDIVSPENTKRTMTNLSHMAPSKSSLYSDKSTVGTKPMTPTKLSPVKTNRKKCSPLKNPHSSGSSSDHGGHGVINDQNLQGIAKRSPRRSLRRAYDAGLKRKKNKKRVCYRKNCHCRGQENIKSTEDFPSVMKEKAKVKLSKEVR